MIKLLKYILLSSFILTAVHAASAQNKRALIIAISEYSPETGWSSISSSNDVSLIKEAILKQGFKEEDIRILLDEQATKSGIQEAFKSHLINGSKRGDIVYFHFSGHGQQVQDINQDEVDLLDESLVPYDAYESFQLGVYEGENHLIDDEMNVYYTQLREKLGNEGHFLCTIDACHSGTSTRGMGKARGTSKVMAPAGYANLSKTANLERGQFNIPESTDGELCEMIAFFGAMPNQLNYETIGDDGQSYGSLSYAFSRAINELDENASYRSLFERMRLIMATSTSKQIPEAEGVIDQNILGGEFLGKPKYFTVKKQKTDNTFLLSAGFLQGLREGSLVGFYPPETRDISEATYYTTGLVTKSKASEAVVKLDSTSTLKDIKYAWVYILSESFGDLSISLNVQEARTLAEGVLDTLEKLPFVDFTNGSAALNLISAGRDFKVVTPTNLVIAEIKGNADGKKLFREIKKVLVAFGQAEYLRKLDQQNKQIFLDFEFIPIEFDIENYEEVSRSSIDEKLDHNQTIRLKEDDIVKIKVTNHGKRKAYFTIVDIQPNNVINVLFPFEGESPSDYSLEPGTSMEVPHPVVIGQPFGQELFKLIASKDPIDLRPIAATQGLGTRGSSTSDPFETLFSISYYGDEVQTRGGKTLSLPSGQVNIFSKSFIIEK